MGLKNSIVVGGLFLLVIAGLAWLGTLGATTGAGVVMVAIGLVAALATRDVFAGALFYTRRAKTDGVVTSSRVLAGGEATAEMQRRAQTSEHRTTGDVGYVPAIEYQYSVGGRSYEGDRVAPFEGSIGKRSRAQQIVDRYPRGRVVTVRYKPGNPEDAVLGRFVPASRVFVSFAAVALFVPLGLWLLAGMPAPGVLPVVAGLVLTGWGTRQLYQGVRSRGWPTTDGDVVSTTIRTSSSQADAAGRTYFPRVRYEYTVGDREYVGSRLSFGGTSGYGTRRAAEEAIDQYEEGTDVAVHFDPDRPGLAVLQPGVSGAVIWIVIGLVFLVVGSAILVDVGPLTAV